MLSRAAMPEILSLARLPFRHLGKPILSVFHGDSRFPLPTVLATPHGLTVGKSGAKTGGMPSVMPPPKATGKSGPWQKVKNYQGLYRYTPKGTYYLRGRFGGSPVRVCLNTSDWSEALRQLEIERGRLKGKQRAGWARPAGTLVDALADLRALLMADLSLKDGTRKMYREVFARMEPGKSFAPPAGPIDKVTLREMAEWWQRVAESYAPQQANHMLMFVRRAVAMAKESQPHLFDPCAKLKRMKIRRTRLELPTKEEFYAIVASIREQRKAHSEEAGDWVEFMAYSGCRPKEIAEVEWRDVKQAHGIVEIWGGKDRTKNGDMRPVPIIAPMAALIARLEARRTTSRLFALKKPHDALKAACARLGLRHQRIYNMRHLFATTCLESGVDVPTLASWLGHRDGGALAMRTYVQNRDAHRDAMAAKVTF